MTEEIAAGVQEGHMCLDFVINTADGSESDKHTYIDLSDTLRPNINVTNIPDKILVDITMSAFIIP